MSQDTELLFSISQAAKACNLSRSTLLRMEERGLLTPAYIAPGSNRRYYDNYNIARILQIKQFQSMGFDTEETAAYFFAEWRSRGTPCHFGKQTAYAAKKCGGNASAFHADSSNVRRNHRTTGNGLLCKEIYRSDRSGKI